MSIKILIIKLGYSETLDPEIGKVPSIGDVLRTTPILWAVREKYPKSNITWLVTSNAEPLIQGIPLIDRVLVWDEFIPFQLMKEKFDVVINLEKIAGVCALTDMIDAWTKYGFRFDSLSGRYHGYENGLDFINYIAQKKTDTTTGYWQQILVELMGVPWKGQPYIVGYKPQTSKCYDIGFNYEVGSKWPVKKMPIDLWQKLEKRLIYRGVNVSWQKGKKNLYEYMDWINSCKLIISSDSLGMHLAFAFDKMVIGLFGPSSSSDVYCYGKSQLLLPSLDCPHRPCMANRCETGLLCMSKIAIEEIENAVIKLLQCND